MILLALGQQTALPLSHISDVPESAGVSCISRPSNTTWLSALFDKCSCHPSLHDRGPRPRSHRGSNTQLHFATVSVCTTKLPLCNLSHSFIFRDGLPKLDSGTVITKIMDLTPVPDIVGGYAVSEGPERCEDLQPRPRNNVNRSTAGIWGPLFRSCRRLYI